MILVTDPGTYAAVYPQLLHAPWMGATATDMIFPSFLFIVGVAITFSFASRIGRGADRTKLAWHVFRRSATLFLLGLAVNGFPDYHWHTLRLPGILQRIALCYLCVGLLYLAGTGPGLESESSRVVRRVVLFASVAFGLLAIYWALLKWFPVPGLGAGRLDSLGNLPAYIDRAVLGTQHLWAYGLTPGVGVTYDPEGILSTLPAIANTLFGVLAGEWMRTERSGRQKALGLAVAGLELVVAGLLLSSVLPLNKRIWTSTFALFSGGVSLLLFAFFYAVVDLRRSHWWTFFAMVLGSNAILAFALSSVITILGDRLRLPGTGAVSLTLHQWGYQHLFASWLAPVHASLAYAIAIVVLNVLILVPLYRKRIFLRV